MENNNLLKEIIWFSQPLFEATVHTDNTTYFFNEFGFILTPADTTKIYAEFKVLTDSVALLIKTIDSSGKGQELNPEDGCISNCRSQYLA